MSRLNAQFGGGNYQIRVNGHVAKRLEAIADPRVSCPEGVKKKRRAKNKEAAKARRKARK